MPNDPHPSITAVLRRFEPVVAARNAKMAVSVSAMQQEFEDLAAAIAQRCDGPDCTYALRKLLDAKHAAINAICHSPRG